MLRRYHQSRGLVASESTTSEPARTAPAAAATSSTPPDEPAADEGEGGWVSHNGLRINADMWLCDLDGAPLELTRSEFDLLLAIMNGQRRVISKDTLALELRGEYGGSGYVSDSDRRAVEVHMANLRRKLNDPVSKPRYIETVRGVGYRLAEPD